MNLLVGAPKHVETHVVLDDRPWRSGGSATCGRTGIRRAIRRVAPVPPKPTE